MVDETAPSLVEKTLACPVCQSWFIVHGPQLYCSKLCRDTAYRRRKRSATRPVHQPVSGPTHSLTVYECAGCRTRALGYDRCEQCRTFMRKVGLGGPCPYCNEPVTVTDLLRKGAVSGGIK